jgi:hypothetical protein
MQFFSLPILEIIMWKKIGITLAIIIVLFISDFIIWGLTPQTAQSIALGGMQSNQDVSVSQVGKWTVFTPTAQQPETGMIFYPGGHVDARSYAHLLNEISAAGYQVVLAPMPLNLAFLGLNQASEIILEFDQIDQWVLTGHSLGGAMSVQYAKNNPNTLDGLILWGSYPAKNSDLSDQDLAAASIYGTLDGLSSLEEIEATKPLLPSGTQFIAIKGGNHAQFGSYGFQKGDLEAAISPEEQQKLIVEATVQFLESIRN